MIRILAGILAAGMSFAASAQVYVAQFPPNPGVLPGGGWQYTAGTTFGDPPGPRAWTNGKYGGIPEFRATDQYRLPGPSGPVNASVVSAAGMRGAALAVGRCVIGLNPACAVGTAAYIAYKSYRAAPPVDNGMVCGGVPCSFPSGQFDYDPGAAPTTETIQGYAETNFPQCGVKTTPQALFECVGAELTKKPASGTLSEPGWSATKEVSTAPTPDASPNDGPWGYGTWKIVWTCRAPCTPEGYSQTGYNGVTIYNSPGTVTQCPASVDALDPAYNVPAGGPVGSDGKCPTARYNHVPRSPEQMADIINSFPPNLPDADWGRAVSDAVDKGAQQAPGSATGSGPATQTGAPVTTSAPNASGGTTTTTTTPTTTYTYNNTTNNYPSVTYTTVNNYTTQTCTGGGSCTTASGSNPGPSSGEPLQDPADYCVKNPTALQCMKVGEPGAEKPTWETKTITYEPESVDLPAQCPTPWTGQFKGHAWTVSFAPACDIAPIIKAALLACVGLGCMLFLSREVV